MDLIAMINRLLIQSIKALAAIMALATPSLSQATALKAYWPLDEAAPPFSDAGPNSIQLSQDVLTTPALALDGIEGNGTLLHLDSPPTTTRLYANGAAIQQDSFGFSFWIKPVSINPFDTLLAKEMTPTNGIPNDERMAWQVHVLNNNGSGKAAIELVVRGDRRSAGNFFGAVSSSAAVPLGVNSTDWIHVAGSYSAQSGRLAIYVNGVESVAQGAPGAHNSDGNPLAIGSAKNGGNIVAYGAAAIIEDIQIYNGSLYDVDATFLMNNPGAPLDPDMEVTAEAVATPTGEVTLRFPATAGASYFVQASTSLASFTQVAMQENTVNLVHDFATAGPWSVVGRDGNSILLRWAGGDATRLFANNPLLQTDSFGFSFWISPSNLNPWDNLIAKEMAFDNSAPGWSRIAWQLHLLNSNAFGRAALELVVRGDRRSVTNFYGFAQSTVTLPLYSNTPEWFHVAGGYDAATGEIRLFVNGNETSTMGVAGAHNSDGSPLAVGSVRNGNDFVQFAAISRMDDIQIYDRPPTAAQVEWLRKWPGQTLPYAPKLVARWRVNEATPPYLDSAQGANIGAIQIPASTLQSYLGNEALSRAFFRIMEQTQNTGFKACD